MTLPPEQVFDSPRGWVARHVRRYVETDGRSGHRWSGVNSLLLTTRGRKSGRLRRTALIYGRDGDRFLVVASQGGARKHPSWYLNLVDNPEVHVQVAAEKFPARARAATAKEKPKTLAHHDFDLAGIRSVSGQDVSRHPVGDLGTVRRLGTDAGHLEAGERKGWS
jgi:deazaflavin-dependent oxidoreductase (nitroreductase family)